MDTYVHRSEKDLQTHAIIGAAMEVHRELGPGFVEQIYQDALEIEFQERGIPFKREQTLPVYYKDKLLKSSGRVDFVCYDDVLVELKALDQLTSRETQQVINYLKATKFKRCLLINFGNARLEFKRYVGPSAKICENLCPSVDKTQE